MQSKTLIALIVTAIVGGSSTAIAKGGGGHGGPGGAHFHGQFHNQFHNHFRFGNRFLRNQAFLNGWWGWGDWGWGGYGDNGYGNNTVVIFPQAIPQAASAIGRTTPCSLSAESFNVPSDSGSTSRGSGLGLPLIVGREWIEADMIAGPAWTLECRAFPAATSAACASSQLVA